ncbi:hypothetical protein ACLGIH_13560 [Streptomyces sp. HMX87]|uniref:hypothetical protein n=1 Tax=Streptomyces sp. HMX87 TaxID=3390849 RepID=UPI003A846476
MTGTRATRRTAALALAAVLACAAACAPAGSGSDAPSSAERALQAAERAVARAGSAEVRSTTVMGDRLSLEAAGTLGWRDALTGTLTLTYTGGSTADTLRGLGTTSTEVRYLPEGYFARMGEEFAERAGGRHWIRYRYEDLENLGDGDGAGAGTGIADGLRSSTPDRSVRLLLTADDLRTTGTQTVRGRRTTHYTGTVDAPGVRTVDVWVDDRDLLVKEVQRGGSETGRLTRTTYYTDYGTAVGAEPPPRRDTADFRELLAGRGGS